MRRWAAIFLLAALFAGCRNAGIRDYWRAHSLDYSDIEAAEDQFARFAEEAVAAPEADAIAALDVLFDQMKKDEVAYYIYSDWLDGAFYNPLSPCRNAALYAKAVERLTTDGILSESECAPYLQKRTWISYNQKGQPATLPDGILDGRRTLVLILDLSCPSCKEALDTLTASSEWKDVRRVAIGCGYGPRPDVPGWDYYFPEDASSVFDPRLTPVYFVVSAAGTVEISYTFA